jgi:hypothetical protein
MPMKELRVRERRHGGRIDLMLAAKMSCKGGSTLSVVGRVSTAAMSAGKRLSSIREVSHAEPRHRRRS